MYGVELMARRKTLGLDLTQTAQLCQVAAGQVQAWEQGTDPVGQNVAGVLRDAEDECAAISEAIMEHAFELAEIEEDELAETLFLGWVGALMRSGLIMGESCPQPQPACPAVPSGPAKAAIGGSRGRFWPPQLHQIRDDFRVVKQRRGHLFWVGEGSPHPPRRLHAQPAQPTPTLTTWSRCAGRIGPPATRADGHWWGGADGRLHAVGVG